MIVGMIYFHLYNVIKFKVKMIYSHDSIKNEKNGYHRNRNYDESLSVIKSIKIIV